MGTSSHFIGRVYAADEVIYQQGDTGETMYLVGHGLVEILQRKGDKEYCLGTLSEGDFFGEMALFGYTTRTATARAGPEGAVILTLEKKSFLKRLHHDPSMAFEMMKKMADRIQHLERELVLTGEALLPMELQ